MSEVISAVQDGDADSLQKALRQPGADPNRIENGMTALLWACQFLRADLVALLLAAGAKPNLCAGDGETPLHVAAFEGCEPCVRLLIEHGADVDARTELGKTPLMNAAQADSPPILTALLKAGADATAVDSAGRGVLHWAVAAPHDDPAIARQLLAAGAVATQKNEIGQTPIDSARLLQRSKLLRALADAERDSA
jgi:ankyrin repeat protein